VTVRLRDSLGINLTLIDASSRFIAQLVGVTDPEEKRRTIGRLFIEEFQAMSAAMNPKAEFLLQGTLYPDVIESISYKVCSLFH
jgi:GMP synthase (glutamine-hydrolysing)